ncbi:hypothetical protein ID866_7994 [Astraeus odoratus]|nr:hypothetical protein ID866_7994 [Astraeus odoratus]
MFWRRTIMFPIQPLLVSTLLALFINDACPTHLGIAERSLGRSPDTERAKVLYNNRLGKRDGSIVTWYLDHSDLYVTSIYPDNSVRYDVMVDIGSSYTWLGADPKNPYTPRPAQYRGEHLVLRYRSATFEGEGCNDIISLGAPGVLTINPQSIGQAITVIGFPRMIDGILGLGRDTIVKDLSGNPIPTVVDNLSNQGTISHAVLGIYFIPPSHGGVGELAFGNYNDGVITSIPNYVPVTSTPPASNYWGIDASLTYGGNTILGPTSGTIDTGTNAIYIASDAFSAYVWTTGAIFSDGWLAISQSQYSNLQTLSIVTGGQTYDLSPNAQIQARSQSNPWIFLVVKNIGKNSGSGMDFALGHPFFQRYYVILNKTSSEIGFASTEYTSSTRN